MTITINLQPEIERGLLAQAEARGVSLIDYAEEVLAREAKAVNIPTTEMSPEARNLVELFAPVRGLFADGELDFSRDQSPGRSVDLS